MAETKNNSSKLKTILLSYNKLAINFLNKQDPQGAWKLLKRAKELLKTPVLKQKSNLRNITMNNLGYYYKNTGKPKLALRYFKKSLHSEAKSVLEKEDSASTHLNICDIKSEQGDHQQALIHAFKALQLASEAGDSNNSESLLRKTVVALHNMVVEYQYLNEPSKAIEACTTALELANRNLESTHPLTKSLTEKFSELKETERSVELSNNFKEGNFRISNYPGFPKLKNIQVVKSEFNEKIKSSKKIRYRDTLLIEQEVANKRNKRTYKSEIRPSKISEIPEEVFTVRNSARRQRKITNEPKRKKKLSMEISRREERPHTQGNPQRIANIRPNTQGKNTGRIKLESLLHKEDYANELEEETEKAIAELEELKLVIEEERELEFRNTFNQLDVIPEVSDRYLNEDTLNSEYIIT